MAVHVRDEGPIRVVVLDRPEARGAVDGEHAERLAEAFEELDARDELSVGILTGSEGHFCSGADLKAVLAGNMRAEPDGRGPMGPTRLQLRKPVIAAIEGHAVAGGLELALWCDLRVASETAVFGVYCRRWGVPLIDGGTVRLPRLVGQSVALDMILTGRAVDADEALSLGLANRMTPAGQALDCAMELAEQIASFPQLCMRQDRASVLEQWGLPHEIAMANEWAHGMESLKEAAAGAQRFASGEGRHGL
jgi:enoyl-CoA hydratase